MTREQATLHRDISRVNKRLARMQAAGVKSPAAERLLTALGVTDNKIRLGRGATLSQEIATQQAIKRFLRSETSTLRGYRAVEQRRLQGNLTAFKDRGFTGSSADMQRALTGAKSFSQIAEMFSMGSDDVQTEFVRGANNGETSEQIMSRIAEMYGNENDIDDLDYYGFYGDENDIDDIEK